VFQKLTHMTSFHAWHSLPSFSLSQDYRIDALYLIWRKLALPEFFYNIRTYFQVTAYRGRLGY
jgi:hypothetical protein